MADEKDEVVDRGDETVVDDKDTVVDDKAAEAAAAKLAAAKAVVDADADDKEKAELARLAGKHAYVPNARMKEAVDKERARVSVAEEKAKALEAKLKVQESGVDAEKVEKEIVGLEELLDKAIADGDVDKKKALRAEIRAKQQAPADAGAQRQASYATAVAVERVRYDAQVALLETQHPVMNPDHDLYDEAAVAELIELKEAYEAGGLGSTDALKKAAKYVFKTAPEQVKAEEKPLTDEAKKAAADAAAKLKEEAIRRGLEAKSKQPADTDKAGTASDKRGASQDSLDVRKMTDKDFAKLEDKDLAHLRGDAL